MPPAPSLPLEDSAVFPSVASKREYKDALKHWQKQLTLIQQAYFHQQRRAIVVFEGWDAAGKGGAIRRITETLDPRGFRVYPIGKPSAEEQSRHYLYRFFTKLPKPGTIAIFDRSYYGRVLVERVDGYASDNEWKRAYQEINGFEQTLADDGVRFVKIFLHIDEQEQTRRFIQRLHNPLKRWKLTEEDLHNRRQRPAYVEAVNDMLTYTHTPHAPWHMIMANHKWFTRVEVLRHLATTLSADVEINPPPLDPSFIANAEQQLGINIRACNKEESGA